MSSVFLDSATNSTMFTTCCRVAICDDQERCPNCKEEVHPRTFKDRWNKAYAPFRRASSGKDD